MKVNRHVDGPLPLVGMNTAQRPPAPYFNSGKSNFISLKSAAMQLRSFAYIALAAVLVIATSVAGHPSVVGGVAKAKARQIPIALWLRVLAHRMRSHRLPAPR